jgi:regulator of protease activity HflC (stomatin/prohibitin superfamily)
MIPFNSIVLFGIAFFLLVVLMRTIKIVPQTVKTIERLSKFRTARAPEHHRAFLDSVRATSICEQSPRSSRSRSSRDNVTMEVDAVIYYLLRDPIAPTGCRTCRGAWAA